MVALAVCVGILSFVIGFLAATPFILHMFRVGSLVIDQTDPQKDLYSFEIETGLSRLAESEYVTLKVKKVKDAQNLQSLK